MHCIFKVEVSLNTSQIVEIRVTCHLGMPFNGVDLEAFANLFLEIDIFAIIIL